MKKSHLFILLSVLILGFASCNSNQSSSTGDSDSGSIKVGVLHSLSGTMAISETDCKNAVKDFPTNR